MKKYDVIFRNAVIGSVLEEDSGLYKHFLFKSKSIPREHHRLIGKYQNKLVNFGICCVEKGEAYINTKVPKKKLGNGIPSFYLEKVMPSDSVEANCDKPFERLKDLLGARYVSENGVKWICFTEDQQSRQGR